MSKTPNKRRSARIHAGKLIDAREREDKRAGSRGANKSPPESRSRRVKRNETYPSRGVQRKMQPRGGTPMPFTGGRRRASEKERERERAQRPLLGCCVEWGERGVAHCEGKVTNLPVVFL